MRIEMSGKAPSLTRAGEVDPEFISPIFGYGL
jgi:hypothetical protein